MVSKFICFVLRNCLYFVIRFHTTPHESRVASSTMLEKQKCPIFTRHTGNLSLSLHLKSHFSKMTIVSTISVLVSFAWLCYRYGGKAPLFFVSLLLVLSIILLCAI